MKLKAKQARAAREALIGVCYRRNPGRGRAAAVAEADRLLGEKGRQVIAEAEQRASRKAARKAAETTALRTAVTEALAAADAPKPAPGAGSAPAARGDDSSMFAVMAAQSRRRSPFWRLQDAPAAPAAVTASAVTAEDLAAMDASAFEAHAASALSAYGRASGYASPIWKDA